MEYLTGAHVQGPKHLVRIGIREILQLYVSSGKIKRFSFDDSFSTCKARLATPMFFNISAKLFIIIKISENRSIVQGVRVTVFLANGNSRKKHGFVNRVYQNIYCFFLRPFANIWLRDLNARLEKYKGIGKIP